MNEELGIEETDAADVVTGIIEEADVVRANTIDGDERVLVTFAVRVAVTPRFRSGCRSSTWAC